MLKMIFFVVLVVDIKIKEMTQRGFSLMLKTLMNVVVVEVAMMRKDIKERRLSNFRINPQGALDW
jgi:hypothetical protein